MSLSRPAAAMLALPLDACLWPAGEGWCGRQATRGAYCATHYRRSVAPEITDLSPRRKASIYHAPLTTKSAAPPHCEHRSRAAQSITVASAPCSAAPDRN